MRLLSFVSLRRPDLFASGDPLHPPFPFPLERLALLARAPSAAQADVELPVRAAVGNAAPVVLEV